MEKNKFNTIEEFNKKANALRRGGIFLTIVGMAILYAVLSFAEWSIDIREWHWVGRLIFIVLSLFVFFFLQLITSRIIADIRMDNLNLFLKWPEISEEETKEAFDKRPQTKSKFQQRLEDLAKERNKPKE